jgi:hypothetical protein
MRSHPLAPAECGKQLVDDEIAHVLTSLANSIWLRRGWAVIVRVRDRRDPERRDECSYCGSEQYKMLSSALRHWLVCRYVGQVLQARLVPCRASQSKCNGGLMTARVGCQFEADDAVLVIGTSM